MEIGKIIRALRHEKHVSQEEAARALGVSAQAVSKWETGASLPDIALLPAISTYFGVSIDELFKLPNEAQFERIENMLTREQQIRSETFEHAVSFLKGILLDEPDSARAYTALAYLYNHRAASDHRLASEYAKRAMELAPDEKPGKVALLEALGGVCGDEWYDNHFELIEYLKGFLLKYPRNFHALYAIIENLLADRRYDEALPYIEDLQAVRGMEHNQPLFYLGDVALGRGDRERALALYDEAVKKNPDTWQAYCSRADRIKKLGFPEQAMADYERCFAMQTHPRITDGLYSLAQMHEGQGDYDAAIADIERIIRCLEEDYAQDEPSAEAQRLTAEIVRLQAMNASD